MYKKYLKFIFLELVVINLCFVSFYVYCQDSIMEDFGSFSMNYYLKPQPERVSTFLASLVKDDAFKDALERDGFLLAYFFGRVVLSNLELISDYKKVYINSDVIGKRFILDVFKIYRTKEVEDFLRSEIGSSEATFKNKIEEVLKTPALGKNALPEQLSDASQLDLAWSDFFVTGNKEPVVRIINVLSWQDRFRDKLAMWMYANHPRFETNKLYRLLQKVGIDVDFISKKIKFQGDMDCLYSAYLQGAGSVNEVSKSGAEIRKILKLSKDDLLYMATKGSAMWSLQSNAKQHPKILEFCKEELDLRSDKSVMELAIIVKLASGERGKITLRGGLTT